MTGHAQSFRDADSDTTGDGLDTSACNLTGRSQLGAKGRGIACPSLRLGTGVGS